MTAVYLSIDAYNLVVDKRHTEEQPKSSENYKYSPASTSAIPALTCFYVESKP